MSLWLERLRAVEAARDGPRTEAVFQPEADDTTDKTDKTLPRPGTGWGFVGSVSSVTGAGPEITQSSESGPSMAEARVVAEQIKDRLRAARAPQEVRAIVFESAEQMARIEASLDPLAAALAIHIRNLADYRIARLKDGPDDF